MEWNGDERELARGREEEAGATLGLKANVRLLIYFVH
jgi:hypothetical protein